MPNHLQRSADTIRDIHKLIRRRGQRTACDDPCGACNNTRIRQRGGNALSILKLHHQRTAGIAFQSQATKDVMVGNFDHASHDMNHVDIVPDNFCGDLAAADFHAIERVVAQAITGHQRSAVACRYDSVKHAGGSPQVRVFLPRHAIDVKRQNRPLTVQKVVVDNDRLRTSNKDRTHGILATPDSV